jgi:hypothetical protein
MTVSGLMITKAFTTPGAILSKLLKEPLRRLSSEHGELVVQRHDLRLERSS